MSGLDTAIILSSQLRRGIVYWRRPPNKSLCSDHSQRRRRECQLVANRPSLAQLTSWGPSPRAIFKGYCTSHASPTQPCQLCTWLGPTLCTATTQMHPQNPSLYFSAYLHLCSIDNLCVFQVVRSRELVRVTIDESTMLQLQEEGSFPDT